MSNIDKIRDASVALGEVSIALSADADKMKEMPVEDALRFFFALDAAYTQLDTVRKQFYQTHAHLKNTALPDMMESKGVKTISLDDVGKRFTTNNRLSASMVDKDEAIKWLKENNKADLVQETVNSGTLSSFAKTYMEDEGMELPSDMFKISTSRYISMTKV